MSDRFVIDGVCHPYNFSPANEDLLAPARRELADAKERLRSRGSLPTAGSPAR